MYRPSVMNCSESILCNQPPSTITPIFVDGAQLGSPYHCHHPRVAALRLPVQLEQVWPPPGGKGLAELGNAREGPLKLAESHGVSWK